MLTADGYFRTTIQCRCRRCPVTHLTLLPCNGLWWLDAVFKSCEPESRADQSIVWGTHGNLPVCGRAELNMLRRWQMWQALYVQMSSSGPWCVFSRMTPYTDGAWHERASDLLGNLFWFTKHMGTFHKMLLEVGINWRPFTHQQDNLRQFDLNITFFSNNYCKTTPLHMISIHTCYRLVSVCPCHLSNVLWTAAVVALCNHFYFVAYNFWTKNHRIKMIFSLDCLASTSSDIGHIHVPNYNLCHLDFFQKQHFCISSYYYYSYKNSYISSVTLELDKVESEVCWFVSGGQTLAC